LATSTTLIVTFGDQECHTQFEISNLRRETDPLFLIRRIVQAISKRVVGNSPETSQELKFLAYSSSPF